MIILDITPLSQNFWVALLEALALLSFFAYLGWWIARRIFSAQLAQLHADIHNRRVDLDNCHKKSSLSEDSKLAQVRATSQRIAVVDVPVLIEEVADDLKIIEGIGPKIEEILNAEGVKTFARLAATSAVNLKEWLEARGPRFQMHDPTTWPEQAALARDGKWDELKKWQDELNKGRLQ